MTNKSRNWTLADATAGLQNEVATMASGGFRLIGAAALMYLTGVYWEDERVKAAEVGARIHEICAALNYGKSSRYQLASAGLAVARNLIKRFGQPDAAKERNVAWVMLQDAATFGEAVDLIVAEIKATYGVTTMSDLYHVLAGNKPKAEMVKSLADSFDAAIKRSLSTPDNITEAIVSVVDRHLAPDQINALLVALAARLTNLSATPVKLAA